MDLYEARVLRLRNRVLENNKMKNEAYSGSGINLNEDVNTITTLDSEKATIKAKLMKKSKADLTAILDDKNIEYDAELKKKELVDLIISHIEDDNNE